MNAMNDERFFDLAMKTIARQATDAERAELDALLANHPERQVELEHMRAEAGLAKETLPMVEAAESSTGTLPGYARERLQTKVRQALGRPEAVKRRFGWSWRWWLALAPATALLVFLLAPLLISSNEATVQVAMLDTDPTRGTSINEITILQGTWKKAPFQSFDRLEALNSWENNWPNKGPVVKIVYDKGAAEVRVVGRLNGNFFKQSFLIENDLAPVLKRADDFIREKIKQ